MLTPVIGPLRQRVNSVTLFTQSTAEANTLNYPSDIKRGDLLVFFEAANRANTSGDVTFPSGYTSLTSTEWSWISGNVFFVGISYKIADGTESGNQITGMSSANSTWEKGLFVFRPNVPIKTATPGGWNFTIAGTNGSSTANASRSITASGSSVPSFSVSFYWNLDNTRTSAGQTTWSTTEDGEHLWGISNNAITKYEFHAAGTSPSDITTATSSWNGRKLVAGGYFNVRN